MVDPLGGPGDWWPWTLALLIGYGLGSIPFGLILTRFAGAGDIRRIAAEAFPKGRPGNQPLDAIAVIDAGARKSVSARARHPHMPGLSMQTPMDWLAARNDADPDAGADGDIDRQPVARAAPTCLGQCRAVDVGFDSRGDVQPVG